MDVGGLLLFAIERPRAQSMDAPVRDDRLNRLLIANELLNHDVNRLNTELHLLQAIQQGSAKGLGNVTLLEHPKCDAPTSFTVGASGVAVEGVVQRSLNGPLYDGPFNVITRCPKYFALSKNDRDDSSLINRAKPAFCETDAAPIVSLRNRSLGSRIAH
ncbi:hypothetical protein HPB52_016364 [Rhipicephalus sanguineus]|uniref:Uncharacterized protein n=1 Tax=Rhipicephalus sanguineus TaxID=34632 RepID=A0A9D4Q6M3_RHISA|nr:hypothetical protein HPB52_016364 [Rhipicephalus sanguineus]